MAYIVLKRTNITTAIVNLEKPSTVYDMSGKLDQCMIVPSSRSKTISINNAIPAYTMYRSVLPRSCNASHRSICMPPNSTPPNMYIFQPPSKNGTSDIITPPIPGSYGNMYTSAASIHAFQSMEKNTRIRFFTKSAIII